MLEPHDACPSCGQDFSGHAAGDGAVYIVLFAGSVLVMALVFSLEMTVAPPNWLLILIGVVATLALTLGLLPITKRFMVAQSIVMGAGRDRPGER